MKANICIVLYSYHHNNTEKIATAISEILEAPVTSPDQIDPEELTAYDCIGFGSGIYSDKHHPSLLGLADSLTEVTEKKAFLFSTCGAPAFAVDGGQLGDYIVKAHAVLKKKLLAKGFMHIDDFMCPGWNTNSFLKFFGGINKGRPNAEDLENARRFAAALKKQL